MNLLAQVLIAVLITVCATTANAQWKFIVENPEADTRWFLDISRIDHDDTAIWVWFLMDEKQLQTIKTGSYYSMEVHEEINCVSHEERFHDYIYYAEPGGRGKVVESDSFGGAGPVVPPPDSIGGTLVKAACDEFVRTYKPKAIKEARLDWKRMSFR